MKQVQFTVVTQRDEARKIWDYFSPHQTIDDDFDFRDAWTKALDFPFHFIVGYDSSTPIGLLALQQNTLKGLGPKLLHMNKPFLEFFAGIDTDDNKVFLSPGYEEYEIEFFNQITTPALLTSLHRPITIGSSRQSEYYLDRYELDLSDFPSFEVLMQKHLDGKSRQRLVNRINKIQRTYQVEIRKGTSDDLPLLFQFSIDRFKEHSSFHMEQRKNVYYDLLRHFNVDLFLILLNGEPKAISFGILHKTVYTTVNIGYDYAIRDLSKFLVSIQLRRAIENGCTKFDAGQGNNGWKEHFNFTKVPQYKLLLNFPQIKNEA